MKVVTTVVFFDRKATEPGAAAHSFKTRNGDVSGIGIANNASNAYLSDAAAGDLGNLAEYIETRRFYGDRCWEDADVWIRSLGLR